MEDCRPRKLTLGVIFCVGSNFQAENIPSHKNEILGKRNSCTIISKLDVFHLLVFEIGSWELDRALYSSLRGPGEPYIAFQRALQLLKGHYVALYGR